MTTPMQRHIQRVREEQAKKAAKENLDHGQVSEIKSTSNDYSAFEVIKGAAEQDNITIGQTAKDERDNVRTSLVKRYMAHVTEYLKIGDVYANPVLVLVMLWLFDLKRIGEALKLAYVAIEQKQVMPKHIKRDLATWVADTVRDWAENEHKAGRPVAPYFYDVFEKLGSWPVPDVVVMKFNKLAGQIEFNADEFEKAITYFEAAEALETGKNKAQVGTKLDAARKKVEKLKAEKKES